MSKCLRYLDGALLAAALVLTFLEDWATTMLVLWALLVVRIERRRR